MHRLRWNGRLQRFKTRGKKREFLKASPLKSRSQWNESARTPVPSVTSEVRRKWRWKLLHCSLSFWMKKNCQIERGEVTDSGVFVLFLLLLLFFCYFSRCVRAPGERSFDILKWRIWSVATCANQRYIELKKFIEKPNWILGVYLWTSAQSEKLL